MAQSKVVTDLILQRVKDAGATGDLIFDSGQSLSLKSSQGTLEEYKVSSTQILGLRVIKDGAVGTAYSEAQDEEALKALVDQALINASFTAKDTDQYILANSASLSTDDATLCPDDETDTEEKIQMVLNMEQALLKKENIKSVPYNGLSSSISERQILSTSGLSAVSRARAFVAYAYGLAEIGDKNAMEGTGRVARTLRALNTDDIVEQVHKECAAMLDGKAVNSGRYDVIFDIEMQSSLFDTFSMALSGKSAKDGINPWRDSVGEQVADPRLQLWDRPLLETGFGSAIFDAEGVATRDIALIENGQLNTLLHNSATGHYFSLESTGHGSRGPKSTLGVSSHQLCIATGDADVAKLCTGKYLEITGLTGLHSGANPISGDFSFGASGYLCEQGQRLHAVRNITEIGRAHV